MRYGLFGASKWGGNWYSMTKHVPQAEITGCLEGGFRSSNLTKKVHSHTVIIINWGIHVTIWVIVALKKGFWGVWSFVALQVIKFD